MPNFADTAARSNFMNSNKNGDELYLVCATPPGVIRRAPVGREQWDFAWQLEPRSGSSTHFTSASPSPRWRDIAKPISFQFMRRLLVVSSTAARPRTNELLHDDPEVICAPKRFSFSFDRNAENSNAT
jgi:hypothetical protein